MIKPAVLVTVSAGNKCPRCWNYHHIDNYDHLCDKCQDVILNDYPDHESIPHIKANIQDQLKKYCARKETEECEHARCCRTWR